MGEISWRHSRTVKVALARFHGVGFAIACASGTFAVEAALRALKVGHGDEVIEAGYDYGGNFLAIHALGARPVLVDVCRHNWNLDPAPSRGSVVLRPR